ncbi:hypothetical protein SCAR479_07082 [Seiridium cardinale]|uniref:Translation initiation factor IF-2, mitochondrial n=1 Tax=Seiridium cardinale TaxID=138064 RepID=A0ABR2XQU3_9PEZI
MLRRGLTERSPSACIFCQHRLSLRRTRLPPGRFLSSTRCLRDNASNSPGKKAPLPGVSPFGGAGGGSGWGKPLFANGPATAKSPTQSGSNAGEPQASSLPTSALLPHEIEARQRMAERRTEEERAEADRAAAQGPKPGVGFRYNWNAKKQGEIREVLQNEEALHNGKASQNEKANRLRFDWSKRAGETAPVYTGSDWQSKNLYNDKPNSLTGRGFSTPPVRRPSSQAPAESKPTFIDRGQAPFSLERRPPRSLPVQSVGSGIFSPPQPLIRSSAPETLPRQTLPRQTLPRQTLPPSSASKSLKDNEIHTPQLLRLMETDGFFEKQDSGDVGQPSALDRDRSSLQGPGSKTGGWGKGIFSNQKPRQTPPDNRVTHDKSLAEQPLRSTWDSVIQHERGESRRGSSQSDARLDTNSSWNSLARKPQAGSASGMEFWSMMEKKTSQPPNKSSQPLDDWGKEFDGPQHQQFKSRSYDNRRPQPSRGREEKINSDVWTSTPKKRLGRESAIETVEIPSAPVVAPSEYQNEDRKSRRRKDSDRSSRFEITRDQDRKDNKKRGGRSSRYDDADEDEGMDDYEDYMDRRQRKAARKAQREAERTEPLPITLPELISISSLASALKVEKTVFLTQLAELGFEGISLDSIMAGETAALVAQEYGYEPTVESGEEQDLKVRPPPEDPTVLPPRPPVVTIMGHVDHGKTTLLDFLRKSSVAAGEHGGITQHIGAFSVSMSTGKQITFLDTPGHAAFLSMRQRGANVTDIVVLVVAADDSVKPQTLEAIKHAHTSKVPIIVAINKIDKEGAQIDRVKADLASNGVEIEDYGGDVQVVCVSGKTGQGMEDLEENILTLSEILDMRAETDGPAEGWILESSLKPIGKAATILVKRGTLRPGDYIVAGTTYAKIRHLRNEAGQEIAEAPPGTPVEILGWRDLPAAGDEVIQGTDERRVRIAAEYREGLRDREQDAAAHQKISEQRRLVSEQRRAEKAAEDGKHRRTDGSWGTQEVSSDTDGGAKMVNFVVKGDVHGSVEAVSAAVMEIGSNEVQPRVLLASPGAITESDVEHAATSHSAIINFNLPVSGLIKRQAETAGVKILDHSVIYHLTDAVKDHLGSFLGVDVSFKVLGEAEVLQIFPINIKGRKYKNIAGCRIRNGVVGRNHVFRVMRAGEKIFEGNLESLKHGKKDIDEARKGGECGIGFEFFQDLEVGDQIQAIEEVQTKRTL